MFKWYFTNKSRLSDAYLPLLCKINIIILDFKNNNLILFAFFFYLKNKYNNKSMKISIYCIEDVNGLKYVGSTKESLRRRHKRHIVKKKSTNDKTKTTSRYLDLDNSKIYLLEECNENNRYEREQFHILNTNCVNLIKTNNQYNRQQYRNWVNSFGRRDDNNLQRISPHLFL